MMRVPPRLARPLADTMPPLTGLAAVILDRAALGSLAPDAPDTDLTLAVAFYWALYRPEIMGPPLLFLLGLASDALAGLPLGFTALTLLAVGLLVRGGARWLPAQPPPLIWAAFAVVAVSMTLLRWLLASLYFAWPFAPGPLLLQLGLTLLLYPPIAWLLDRLRRPAPETDHARAP